MTNIERCVNFPKEMAMLHQEWLGWLIAGYGECPLACVEILYSTYQKCLLPLISFSRIYCISGDSAL